MDIKKTFHSVDGNTACAMGSYNFTEVAGIYPITPSSPMAEAVDEFAAKGKLNFFGSKVKVAELQSEGGASGAVHGALQAGALATTYTASQGLLLMIPNIYKWVGELLPAVLHVSARSLATRSLSIFGDHQDIYAIRQTGCTMICSHSVQEAADLANVAHLVAIDSACPVCHFFDGFRTSHEIQNVEFIDDNEWKKLLPTDKLEEFRKRALNPHTHAVTRGGAENDDIYFQGREAQNKHHEEVIKIAEKYFKEASRLTGRKYAPFTYYGDKDATDVVIAMGSVTECTKEVIDFLVAKGKKVGLVKVHLYRPFSAKHFVGALPASCKRIAVLDRTKEPGSIGEPLYLDVVAALTQLGKSNIKVYGGRYGLSSKDTQPKHIKSVYDFLKSKDVHHNFTVGITDDVTKLSIPVDESFVLPDEGFSCLFYGLGSDGTVSANKSSIKIIGDATHQYAQAYFQYDSRKAGGVTRSHLRFGKKPIRSTYYVKNADFISCSLDTYIFKFDILSNLKKGGTFLLNTDMDERTLLMSMPDRMKCQLATKKAKFFVIDANKIAASLGMGRHTNTILQASFFFLNQGIMPYQDAQTWMKKFAEKSYAKKGQEVVEQNYKAIDGGANSLKEIKVMPEWARLSSKFVVNKSNDSYFDEFVNVIGNLEGDSLPTSCFLKGELLDGTMQNNITYYEQRSIADKVPAWNKENCIQCGKCAFVCPHATIRPFLLNKEDLGKAPKEVQNGVVDAIGPNVKGLKFRIQVSPKNCVGCGLCVSECPANKRPGKEALQMVEAKSQFYLEKAATYLFKKIPAKDPIFPVNTEKGVSLMTPYMEISGACAGCGETPYYRLLSQLFGRDLLIANATGCSSIYSGSTPLTPFVTDKNKEGVAWANSLFEDNAEYGYGMRVATDYKLNEIKEILTNNLDEAEPNLKKAIKEYLDNIHDKDLTRKIVADKLIPGLKATKSKELKKVLKHERDLVDKSIWIVGGDGWSYDIGYGGLDHVLASNENINILVLDTEVYSNTGGQSSKSTQTGAIAKFAAAGKRGEKKNLALMAMAYRHCYVAQITMSNSMNAIKALKEAEAYNGPSIVICYAPCANHGIKGGLGHSIDVERKAVASGFFSTFRYDPTKPTRLTLDNPAPDWSKFREFMLQEARFFQLPKVNPEHAEELLKRSEELAKDRYEAIKKFGL